MKVPVALTSTIGGQNQAGGSYSNVCYNAPFWGYCPTSAVSGSQLYRQYCKLYDEVQCIGYKVRLAFTNQLGAALPSIRVHSCWDRRFGSQEQAPDQLTIRNSSSYMPSQAIQNSVCKMQRSCYASDLIEKIQWHDCTITDPTVPGQHYSDPAWESVGNNPNFFCPGFFFYVEEPGMDQYVPITVSSDIVYYFKFRNPRFGGSAGNAKISEMDAPNLARGADPDVDMDHDAGEPASLSGMVNLVGESNPDDYHRAGLNQGGVRPPEGRAAAMASAKHATMMDPPGPVRSRPVFGGRGSLNTE